MLLGAVEPCFGVAHAIGVCSFRFSLKAVAADLAALPEGAVWID
jgi:hypothetical protein